MNLQTRTKQKKKVIITSYWNKNFFKKNAVASKEELFLEEHA
jgi:hypothetical protein